MWKKKLIVFVTFIAGLYYFLEFVVPPTLPWQTATGVVKLVSQVKAQSGKTADDPDTITQATVDLTEFKKVVTMPVNSKLMVTRQTTTPTKEDVVPGKLNVTDGIQLTGDDQGVVIAKNNAAVKVGILGDDKEIAETVPKLVVMRADKSGAENRIDDPNQLAASDLITRTESGTNDGGVVKQIWTNTQTKVTKIKVTGFRAINTYVTAPGFTVTRQIGKASKEQVSPAKLNVLDTLAVSKDEQGVVISKADKDINVGILGDEKEITALAKSLAVYRAEKSGIETKITDPGQLAVNNVLTRTESGDTGGVIKSVSTDPKTNVTTIKVTGFKRIDTINVDPSLKLTRKYDKVAQEQIETQKLTVTNLLLMPNNTWGVVIAKNSVQMRVGVLGDTKKLVVKLPKTLLFRTDESGGESQVDSVFALAPKDLLSRIGPSTYLSGYIVDVNNFFVVLQAMPWGYALLSLFFMHTTAIRKRSKEWFLSVLFFCGLALGVLAGHGYGLLDAKLEAPKARLVTISQTVTNPAVRDEMIRLSKLTQDDVTRDSLLKLSTSVKDPKIAAGLVEAAGLVGTGAFDQKLVQVKESTKDVVLQQRITAAKDYLLIYAMVPQLDALKKMDNDPHLQAKISSITEDVKAEQTNSFYDLLNITVSQYIAFAFYSATFSILSFYLASAAYRSFKAKSREAVLMMVSALVVMLGQIPFGQYMTGWLPWNFVQMPVMSRWLQMVLNTAAYRGMWFGMMLAMMAIGLRFWLSLERGAFFDREL